MSAPLAVPLVVAKIGGSLLGSPRLDQVLRTIVQSSGARVVIVPGGGPFADAVRAVQAAAGFGDALADRLALEAMDHTAQVFADREPALRVVHDRAAIAQAFAAGRVPVWSPVRLRDERSAIPVSWDVSADSLALWLAAVLDADRLVLVKSVEAGRASFAALAAAGVVDAAFPAFAARFGGEIAFVGPARDGDLGRLLTHQTRKRADRVLCANASPC